MNEEYPIEESHCLRSMFVQRLVQEDNRQITESSTLAKEIPKKIIQFWDNLNLMPQDVSECLDTWRKLEKQGVVRQLFDDHQARIFIYHRLGSRYKQAYDRCYHPAMKSDYFRLCYIFMEGGCYIDADDVYLGIDIQRLFNDGRLKIQPLCYDMKTDSMVPPSHFTKQGAIVPSWIFYFNNNPLIAGSGHPIIERALETATLALEQDMSKELPDIQSTTGPGNLTKSIFDICLEHGEIEESILVLHDWENIATSKWPLSYRDDERNWRLSDRKRFSLTGSEVHA